MEIDTNKITVQYYIDRQRYLDRLASEKNQSDLRYRELQNHKDHIERINRSRELEKNLGQNIDRYV